MRDERRPAVSAEPAPFSGADRVGSFESSHWTRTLDMPGSPALDLLHGDVLELHLAEHGQQVDLDRVAVSADDGRFAAAVLLGEPQVLRGRLGERDAAGDARPGTTTETAACRRTSSSGSCSQFSASRLVK